MLVFVGIAGALTPALHLGDVVVATRVHALHGGKHAPEGFLARPEGWACSHSLLQTARHALRGPSWWPERQGRAADPLQPVAAGDVVLNCPISPLRGQLHALCNDAVAIEMESAGVAHAAQIGGIDTLTVRGISDRADGSKYAAADTLYQPRAAARAAAAVSRSSGTTRRPPPPASDRRPRSVRDETGSGQRHAEVVPTPG
ncbi:hypothetical protein NKH77_01785 [Streptomyces sp. M19]